MSTKKVLGLLGIGLLSTSLTAGMCGPTESTDCATEGDCSTEQHCHPTLKVCVDNCKKVTTACDAEPGTTCSETDIITPVNAMSFNGVCVCDPASDTCSGGEKCNPTDRVCDTPCTADTDCAVYPSDQSRTCQLDSASNTKFCLPPADSCIGKAADFCGTEVCNTITGSTNYGKCIAKCTANSCTSPAICETSSGLCITPCTAGQCGTGKYCDDSRFDNTGACIANPTSCDNQTNCFDNSIAGLCDPVTTNETHNLCVAPDDVTNTCSAPGQMEDGGVILWVDDPSADIEELTAADDTGSCITDGGTLMIVYLMVEGTLNSAVYTNTKYYNGTTWAAVYQATASTSAGVTLLGVQLCFNATTETRAIMHDNGTGESNRACVDFNI